MLIWQSMRMYCSLPLKNWGSQSRKFFLKSSFRQMPAAIRRYNPRLSHICWRASEVVFREAKYSRVYPPAFLISGGMSASEEFSALKSLSLRTNDPPAPLQVNAASGMFFLSSAHAGAAHATASKSSTLVNPRDKNASIV